MSIEQFLKAYGVMPADAIVVKKEYFGILDHYVIYLGKDGKNEHKFIANYVHGIKFISVYELIRFLETYVPVRINRFLGNEFQRVYAVKRALSRLNEKTYHLLLNNCEHFANWVQNGKPTSKQVEDFGKLLALIGGGIGLTGLASKNQGTTLIGTLIASLGLILIGLSVDDKDDPK